ncbi:amino acid permease [Actinomadura hibisca]|uniref:amino acid permease n=1 Tax=Actinomadura hibisca TaxID=68565 RepID=UPI000B21B956|nr:amino acid permease [Actinomadura hibisca]
MAERLQPGLRDRHVSMIAIGGVIGAGLFVGSGAGVHKTGPGILVSYALAGLLVILVMRMLGEMAAAHPDTGSFSAYADRAIGRWAGFTIGWLYWWFWAVVLAVEATAGAKIVHGWVPALPQWTVALVLMVLLTATNLFSVASYGEFEFWFAAIKVAAIAVFILLGGLAIFGLLPGTDAVGTSNLVGHGGFLPNGPGAVVTGLLTVVFAFMGSEIVTIAAAESRDPGRAVTKAVNSVIWRIIVFYLGSIAVVVTLLPWDSADVGSSPYVAVLDEIGIPGAGPIMDVVVLTAVLSCLNSGLYTASRMAFSLAGRGDAPRAFARTTRRGVPWAAIWVSVAFGFVAVVFNYTSPDTVFLFLVNGSGAVALFVWLVVACSQLRMRRRLEGDKTRADLPVRMWLFPYLTIATIVAILGVLVTMLFDDAGRPQVLWSLAVAAVVLVAAFVRHGRSGPRAPARETAERPVGH